MVYCPIERRFLMVQILVLAAVALFLFWRLRSVLGSRQGFEKNTVSKEDIKVNKKENKTKMFIHKSKLPS